jgi:hypothetical protein
MPSHMGRSALWICCPGWGKGSVAAWARDRREEAAGGRTTEKSKNSQTILVEPLSEIACDCLLASF